MADPGRPEPGTARQRETHYGARPAFRGTKKATRAVIQMIAPGRPEK
jgi:hypothetical protein